MIGLSHDRLLVTVVVRAGRGASIFPSARFFGIMIAMKRQETLQPKKRRGPAPTGIGTPVQVRLQPRQLAAVDKWRSKQPDVPSRPEAVRRLISLALAEKGIS